MFACSLVDDDTKDCDGTLTMDYELRLVTNLTTELETHLSMETEATLIQSIRKYLEPVFTDRPYDVELEFYDMQGASPLMYHESHVMDASQSSYTLYVPVRDYMHLAIANLSSVPSLSLEGDDFCGTAKLSQEVKDTISPHKAGVFTARLPMYIKENENQKFDVHLYMANCVSVFMADTTGSNIRDMKVFTGGFASDFEIRDSVYHYSNTPVMRTDRIAVNEGGNMVFASVSFPSLPGVESKSDGDGKDQVLWQIRCYATTAAGTVTETVMGVSEPLAPGDLKLIRAKLHDDGSISTDDTTIGISVILDWQPGTDHDVVF